jgi:hypothetical protein
MQASWKRVPAAFAEFGLSASDISIIAAGATTGSLFNIEGSLAANRDA